MATATGRTTGAVLAAVIVLAAGVLGWFLYTARPEDRSHPGTEPAATGLVDGTGPVVVEVWLDPTCADCGELITEVGATLSELVSEGQITRIYHPVPLRESSVRVAASLGCAAEHGDYLPYLRRLLARTEPPPGTLPSDDQLIHLAATAGLIDPAFAGCVRHRQYADWAHDVAAHAVANQVVRLPTLRVERIEVELSAEKLERTSNRIRAAVKAASAGVPVG